ncbi:MAG: glycosyltransferase [Phycisphaerales bacterium]|nr:glycosyltransferase [Phycisphaerales bacterium]
MNESVSVVIPVYNEIENLDTLLERVVSTCEKLPNPWEVILVDDGSRDGSTDRLEAAAGLYGGHLRAIILNRNYGQHAAIICGFSHARGDIVITLDADLQNPPEEIPNLVRTIEQGNDVVGTIRRNRQDSFFRRKASACINWMVQKSTGVAMRDYGCMLRAYRRPVINAILQCRERSTFIPVLANTFAKRAAEIEVGHAERAAGESKYSLWKLINLQFDLLTSMTTTPLRLLSWAGAAIALGGFGFGVLLLAGRIFLGAEWAENGVFTLFAILFIFVGAQFIGMGLLGEYLGRVYHDVRGRPRYFIDHIAGDSGLKRSTPDPNEAAESAESPHGVTIETGISL